MQDPSLLQNSSPHPTPMDSRESLKGTSLNNQPVTSMDVFPLSPQLFLIPQCILGTAFITTLPWVPSLYSPATTFSPWGHLLYWAAFPPARGTAVSPQALTCHHGTYCQSANMRLPSQGQVRVWQARHSPWVQNLRERPKPNS